MPFVTAELSQGSRAADRSEPAVIVSGSFDLQLSAANATALETNRMGRDNRPLSQLRLSLCGDLVASERLSVFNHLPIGPASPPPYIRSSVHISRCLVQGTGLRLITFWLTAAKHGRRD